MKQEKEGTINMPLQEKEEASRALLSTMAKYLIRILSTGAK